MRARFAVLSMLIACGAPMPRAQKATIGVRGLWTSPNDLLAPDGAMRVADDVVIDRPGVVEPRRGSTALSANLAGTPQQLAFFQGQLIAHYLHTASGQYRIAYWNGAVWTDYSGTYDPPSATARVRFVEDSGSLFVNTADGEYKLDAPTGSWRLAGCPRGYDATGTLDRTSAATLGPLQPNTVTAWRHVWARKDAHGRIERGAPSGRTTISNPAKLTSLVGQMNLAANVVTVNTTAAHGLSVGEKISLLETEGASFPAGLKTVASTPSATQFTYAEVAANAASAVDHTFGFTDRVGTLEIPIPPEVTTTSGHFLELYRSGAGPDAFTEPDDEMAKVYEAIPTNVDIAAGSITIVDSRPESLRNGAVGYWCPSAGGGGILAANDRAPVAIDVAAFAGCMFFLGTTYPQSIEFQILSLEGWNTVAAGKTSAIGFGRSGLTVAVAVASADIAEDLVNGYFQLFTAGTPAQNIADTARSIVRVINAQNGGVVASYESADDELPGRIRVTATSPGAAAFEFFTGDMPANAISPAVKLNVQTSNAGQTSRAGALVTATTHNPHGFVTGQIVYLNQLVAPDANFPTGAKTITVVDADTFTYVEAGAAVASAQQFAFYTTPVANVDTSTSTQALHSLLVSKPGEPEHVPAVTPPFSPRALGSMNKAGQRLLALKDRLLVFKEDGVWTVTGSWPNFQATQLEPTLKLIAPETAVVVGGKAYAVTNQGVVEILDSARVVSLPIESTLLDATRPSVLDDFKVDAFAVGYETARRYIPWLGLAGAYPYGVASEDWTHWTTPAVCAAVNPETDQLYLAKSDGTVLVERKARDATDYEDPGPDPIESLIEFHGVRGEAPGAEKQFLDGALLFEDGAGGNLTMSFTTDHAANGGSTQVAAAGLTVVPFWAPLQWSRGSYLRVRLQNSGAPDQPFALKGFTLNYRIVSDQVGR